jgi:DNA uptake protein ComE-like DNA-binding protein
VAAARNSSTGSTDAWLVEDLAPRREAEAEPETEEMEAVVKERDALRERVEQLEAELDGVGSEPRAKPRASANEKVELNSATFEELRELGLSITQSARLIANRDARGGYEALDQLDAVPGIPQELRDEVKGRLRLNA